MLMEKTERVSDKHESTLDLYNRAQKIHDTEISALKKKVWLFEEGICKIQRRNESFNQ